MKINKANMGSKIKRDNFSNTFSMLSNKTMILCLNFLGHYSYFKTKISHSDFKT